MVQAVKLIRKPTPPAPSAQKRRRAPNSAKGKAAAKKKPDPLFDGVTALRTLEELVAKKRAHYDSQREAIPSMREEAQRLRVVAADLRTSRLGIKLADAKEEEARGIDKKIEAIERGDEQKEYERKAARYLEMARWNYEQETVAMNGWKPPSSSDRTKRRTGIASKISNSSASSGNAHPPGEEHRAANRDVLRQYLAEFEGHPPPMQITQRDICSNDQCAGAVLVLSLDGSLLLCPQCNTGYPHLDATAASMSYGDEVEYTSFTYKKQHHFEDWLKKFQAKSNRKVDRSIINQVIEWHVDNGFTSSKDISKSTVRDALRYHDLETYYDCDMQIFCRITGTPPPYMTPEQEEICRLMFSSIQAPYMKWKEILQPERINFLAYGYVLYKFCQLLGWDHYLQYFTLLRGDDKLMKQEAIWKGICAENDWEFIPAVRVAQKRPRFGVPKNVRGRSKRAKQSPPACEETQ